MPEDKIMSRTNRLTEVFESSEKIPFDDSSKFILFSDLHRGDNSWADDFAHNQNIFFQVLNYYYDRAFTYIELGDGDELWENVSFEDIRKAHSHVFWKMSEFHKDNRLYLIWGAIIESGKTPTMWKSIFTSIKMNVKCVINHFSKTSNYMEG
jgi:hypothetical protein